MRVDISPREDVPSAGEWGVLLDLDRDGDNVRSSEETDSFGWAAKGRAEHLGTKIGGRGRWRWLRQWRGRGRRCRCGVVGRHRGFVEVSDCGPFSGCKG